MFSVIFDMDGTLLDTQSICAPAWKFAGNEQGIEGVEKGIFSVCGMNEAGWTAFLEENYPTLDIAKFKKDSREYIVKNLVVCYKKGAKELLDYLKKRNIKIALASGSTRGSIDHHLKEVGAEKYFDVILGSADIENGKPAPDIFLKCAKLMCVNPEDCFVFEDSENGIKAGFAAGMKCIGVADTIPFNDETKKLMYRELESLNQAIEIFENEL